jgi:hypothetical protein
MMMQTERRKAQISVGGGRRGRDAQVAADLPPVVMCSSSGSSRRLVLLRVVAAPPPSPTSAQLWPSVEMPSPASSTPDWGVVSPAADWGRRRGGWIGEERMAADWVGVYRSRFSPSAAFTRIGKERERKETRTSAHGCLHHRTPHVSSPTRHGLVPKRNK